MELVGFLSPKWIPGKKGKKKLVIEGGEGSGEPEGHPFRGNQYTVGGSTGAENAESESPQITNWDDRAKVREATKWTIGLAESKNILESELELVKEYVSDGHAMVNNSLRGTHPEDFKDNKWTQIIADKLIPVMDSVMKKSFTTKDTVLYRGVGGMELKVGQTFIDKGFVSCSSQKIVGDHFRNIQREGSSPSYSVKIYVPKGTPAISVPEIGKIDEDEENEVCLNRGIKFVVESVYEKTAVLRVLSRGNGHND
jgi:hypothetical protein